MAIKLSDLEDLVRERIEVERWTHKKLSLYLNQMYPQQKGFSLRSIQRFCAEKDIHKSTRLDTNSLDEVVEDAIKKVCILGIKMPQ